MRLIVRIGLAMVVLLVIGAVTLLRALRPPSPLPPAPQGTTLGNVTVIEPGLARRAGRTIVVKGGSIESIAAASGAEQNDAYAGMFVLPGLIEMHGHLPPASPLDEGDLFPFLYLFHGVTTVRDLGDVDGTAVAPVRDGLRDGKFAGPRLFACGPFVDGKEALWPNSRIVGNGTEAEAAVRGIADAGFDCVKVYDHLPALGLNAVRAAATARGLPVVGHVPNAVSYAEAGIADVQHFTKAPTFDRADPRPFPEAMDAWLAVDDTLMDRIVAHALEHGVANTPTLVATERLSRLDAYDELREEPDAQLLPRVYRDVVWRPTEAFTPEILATLRAAVEKEKRLAKRLHDAGARIHVGSDVLASFIVS